MSKKHSIAHNNRTIPYELTYSKRKSISISVYPDLRVAVRAPKGIAFNQIEDVVKKRAAWIAKQIEKFSENPPLPPFTYSEGEVHHLLGEPLILRVEPSDRDKVGLQNDELWLYTSQPENTEHKKAQLDKWYHKQARQIFAERLEACFPIVEHFGIPYPRIFVREMRTRWGSCSGVADRINLNLKLVQVPVECVDYVIIHELCHFREHNHSPRFYALMDEILPDWRNIRKILNSQRIP